MVTNSDINTKGTVRTPGLGEGDNGLGGLGLTATGVGRSGLGAGSA